MADGFLVVPSLFFCLASRNSVRTIKAIARALLKIPVTLNSMFEE